MLGNFSKLSKMKFIEQLEKWSSLQWIFQTVFKGDLWKTWKLTRWLLDKVFFMDFITYVMKNDDVTLVYLISEERKELNLQNTVVL